MWKGWLSGSTWIICYQRTGQAAALARGTRTRTHPPLLTIVEENLYRTKSKAAFSSAFIWHSFSCHVMLKPVSETRTRPEFFPVTPSSEPKHRIRKVSRKHKCTLSGITSPRSAKSKSICVRAARHRQEEWNCIAGKVANIWIDKDHPSHCQSFVKSRNCECSCSCSPNRSLLTKM